MKKKAMRSVWLYQCSWLIGARKRIVGVEVVEHHAESEEPQAETKGMGIWATMQRRDSIELTEWARKHYEKTLGEPMPLAIREQCGKVPTIRIERFESAEAPDEPPSAEEGMRKQITMLGQVLAEEFGQSTRRETTCEHAVRLLREQREFIQRVKSEVL